MKKLLSRKIGPFPAIVWVVFVLGLALILYIRRRNAAAKAATQQPTDPNAQPSPNDATAGQYNPSFQPADGIGQPLPVNLIITLQNGNAARPPTKLNAKRGVPKKLTKHQQHLRHLQHVRHVQHTASTSTGGAR